MKQKKNGEYKEKQITTMNTFDFTFYINKLYFTSKHNLKKSSLYHYSLFTVLMIYRIFETQ